MDGLAYFSVEETMAVNALNITTGEIVWTYKGMQKLSELVGRGGGAGVRGASVSYYRTLFCLLTV